MIVLSAFIAALLAGPLRAQTWISHDQDAPPSAGSGISSSTEVDELPPLAPPSLEPLTAEPTAQAAVEEPPVLPTYLALKPNLNDFVGFSDGGWNGNWYVGYNSCWIVRLPQVPPGSYQRAFIGAKLGRAKMGPKADKAFDRVPVPGKIYMALGPAPAFTTEKSYFLTGTDDIPSEPDPNLISTRVGDPGWLWTEVPVDALNTKGPNYLAIWSNTEGFVSASSAPILAAAMTDGPTTAWLNRSIHGVPPRDSNTSLETQLNRLLPALAIKLVPPNNKQVKVGAVEAGRRDGELVLRFAVEGQDIESAWYEVSYEMPSWLRDGPLLRHPPYAYTLPDSLEGGHELYVRGVAVDDLGNQGESSPVKITK